MPTIYRKTAKGSSEIETRAHKLSPRARGVLILVDGKRDEHSLAGMAQQQGPQMLAALLADGFIEIAARAAEAVAAAEAAASPVAGGSPGPQFETLRREVVRALTDALGPTAETLAIKLERARDGQALTALLPQAVALLGALRGRAAAENFAARFAVSGAGTAEAAPAP